MDVLAVGMLVIIFTIIFGLILSRGQIDAVKANWAERRCEPGVMFAGFMYRPDGHPSSATAFAADNFQFCMKSLVQTIINEIMHPIYKLFGGVIAGAKSAGSSLNSVRSILGNVAKGFTDMLQGFMGVYQRGMMQALRTGAMLKMAYNRMLGIVLSVFYAGLSTFFAGLNMMSFVIKVVMIILGILLALVIILIFVLFPYMPIIMTVIAILVAAVATFTGIIGAEIYDMADGFCFAGDSLVKMNDGTSKPISEINIGDVLWKGGAVNGTLKFSGADVALFNYKGIKVSGEHLVHHENLRWMKIIQTGAPSCGKEEFIYSLVTDNNRIPILGESGETINFADWEEFSDDSILREWHAYVQDALKIPGKLRRSPSGPAHLAGKVMVQRADQYIPVSSVKIGDLINDYNCQENQYRNTKVIGIYETNEYANRTLSEGVWKWCGHYWSQGNVRESGFRGLIDEGKRYHLITSTGTFAVNLGDSSFEYLIRDFTEMGVTNLKNTSSAVVAALNRNHQ
jgi:hypothetical protein